MKPKAPNGPSPAESSHPQRNGGMSRGLLNPHKPRAPKPLSQCFLPAQKDQCGSQRVAHAVDRGFALAKRCGGSLDHQGDLRLRNQRVRALRVQGLWGLGCRAEW